MYKAFASDCGPCPLKPRCTQAPRRGLARHLYEDALNRMQARVTPEAMRLRRSTVEHPFATIKYRIFGHGRKAGFDKPTRALCHQPDMG